MTDAPLQMVKSHIAVYTPSLLLEFIRQMAMIMFLSYYRQEINVSKMRVEGGVLSHG